MTRYIYYIPRVPEYNSVCPLVRIGTPHPLSRTRVCPPSTKGGDTLSFADGGGGGVPIRRTAGEFSLALWLYSVLITNNWGREWIQVRIFMAKLIADGHQEKMLSSTFGSTPSPPPQPRNAVCREKKGQGGGARHDFSLSWLVAERNRVQKRLCITGLLFYWSREYCTLTVYWGQGSHFRWQQSKLLLLCHGMLSTFTADLLVT